MKPEHVGMPADVVGDHEIAECAVSSPLPAPANVSLPLPTVQLRDLQVTQSHRISFTPGISQRPAFSRVKTKAKANN